MHSKRNGGGDAGKARNGIAVALAAALLALCAVPAAADASLSIEAPAEAAVTGTTPTFRGSTSEANVLEEVSVSIHEGDSTEGQLAEPAFNVAPTLAGTWAVAPPSPLAAGTYTVLAEQPQGESLERVPSNAVTFTVDASSPSVALTQPASPSGDTEPDFTGTASDTTPVTVRVYPGSVAAGQAAAEATATGTPGSYETTPAQPALGQGEYTAIAEQPSSLGNKAGKSEEVHFSVVTKTPAVTLKQPASPSSETEPAFGGTASETTTVTVNVWPGTHASGTPTATATATGTGSTFTTAKTHPTLAEGEYTAVAEQTNPVDNKTGKSEEVHFSVVTKTPAVTLKQPASPSSETEPAFGGSASETTTVTVNVWSGTHATGTPTATATATGTGSTFTTAKTHPTLAEGEYTAVAEQTNPVDKETGKSGEVHFSVVTKTPAVTLKQPASPSGDTEPNFTGTASDTSTVTVHVWSGAHATGTPTANATAGGTGGAYSTGKAQPALAEGEYTAMAEQTNAVDNKTGRSGEVHFTVITAPPHVTLKQPTSPSKTVTPAFSGTASEPGQVTVHVHEGSETGPEVARVSATAAGGEQTWTSGATAALKGSPATTYVAIAEEPSALGNPPGKSAPVTFVVDTAPPTVTLFAPQSPTNNRTPVFEGTASDTTNVTVRVYVGKKAEPSKEVSSASATPSGGTWATKPTITLPDEEHTYTAVASEPSSLGNAEGSSAPVTFVVDPEAPTVTLNPPGELSNDAAPSFSGSANDHTPVTVEIEAAPSGPVVATASATGTGGPWSSGPASPALPDGNYIVHAQQESFAGHIGASQSYPYTVDTVAPQASVTRAGQSSAEAALIAGTAGTAEHDLAGVVVQVFAGSAIEPGQAPVQSLEVGSSAGAWSATVGGLGVGTYTTRAEQRDGAGNVGVSGAVTFAIAPPVAASRPAPPTAAFSWLPAKPHAGESVSLVSSSTDAFSPIVGFAWNLGSGTFAAGGPDMTTSFAAAGNDTVQLRVAAADGLASVATETIPVGQRVLPPMAPFPVVRITSLVTRSGTRIGLLSVSAPAGARITVRCNGHGCPLKSQSRAVAAAGKAKASFVTFSRFERTLAPGVTLRVSVTKAGAVGKYVRLRVRRRKLPLRTDRCLDGVSSTPVACPT